MNKYAIKVVKRNNVGAQETPVVVNASKVEKNEKLKLADMVGNWISERRENSREEKTFSDSKILSWKIMSENLKKTILRGCANGIDD